MPQEQTQLQIQLKALPPNFIGTPQEFADAMVERMKIVSPFGGTFFVVGDTEPPSNQGPWLKGGTKWYVFDETLGRYVPLDISDSETILFHVQSTTPSSSAPPVWLRTQVVGGVTRYIGWYFFDGTNWRPAANIINSGTTAERPSSPLELERFYDTTIGVEIWWERSAWRTVSGSPGDIKLVTFATLAEATTQNPGWQEIGQTNSSLRGRVFASANKDPGATPAADLSTAFTSRAAGDLFGEESHILSSSEMEQHTHIVGHATLLNSDNNAQFFRVESVDTLAIPLPDPPNGFQVNGEGTTNGTLAGSIGTGPAGTQLITSVQLPQSSAPAYTAAAAPHNIVQPTVAFWALVKL
jgi:hypothetical protein